MIRASTGINLEHGQSLSTESPVIGFQASVGSVSVIGHAMWFAFVWLVARRFDDTDRIARPHHRRMQDFRRLRVWKRAHLFALAIRRAAEAFPPRGYADLKSQITRAAESIADNIVEGFASASRKEFAHYLNISIKSSSEVDYQLEYARDLGVMTHDVWKPLAKEVIEIRKMLSALRRRVLNAADAPEQSPAEPETGLQADMPDQPSPNRDADDSDPKPEDTGTDA